MTDASHNDIYKRVEKVEIDVAVLDNKTNRLHLDLVDLKADTKMNGELTRETKTKVDSFPRLLLMGLSALGVLFTALTFITRTLA